MSYKAVESLSRKYDGIDCLFIFPNEEAYNEFDVPFPTLKPNDRVSITGCKKVWTVRNVNEHSVFKKPDGSIWALGTVTISDEKGYYASIHRSDISEVLHTKEEEEIFKNKGQLTFSF
ncbi:MULTISPECIES: hypothetical protein [Metabacillus]|uniref:hypothetical protein n=1 Tax=Metabacillus TaxID=2675233 RepID=UPI000C7F85FB|nr:MULTISPECIES: hypothetical protein [Metabacillus]MCM3444002.1 hypothetical protein [Metabacillus halosaccharovorans]PMC34947.1 hypothetical protein CJ195_20785 [Bacillus sp. UMB0899]